MSASPFDRLSDDIYDYFSILCNSLLINFLNVLSYYKIKLTS
jgi:hypothetical protein